MQPASFISILAVICISACTTPPKPKAITRAEIVERDNAVGVELSGRFESQVKLKTDQEVSVYLRKVAQKLSEVSAELRTTNVGVLLLRDEGSGKPWRNYGLPGNRIYLSSAILRELEFENEVAALIAFELGHILKRHLMDRIEADHPRFESTDHSQYPRVTGLGVQEPDRGKNLDFFGPSGLFVFKEEMQLEAVDVAVDLLYRGGYDPRGLLGVWQAYSARPKQSPLDVSTLQKLVERTRRVISGYVPLLYPIVRSEEFMAVQKRIKRL